MGCAGEWHPRGAVQIRRQPVLIDDAMAAAVGAEVELVGVVSDLANHLVRSFPSVIHGTKRRVHLTGLQPDIIARVVFHGLS